MHRQGYELFDAQVSEMQSELANAGNDLVPVDAQLLNDVAADDSNPLFVTMNIAREGVSKNGRHYSRETIQSMCDQINAEVTDGHNGHIKDEDRATARPDPAALWLGARVIIKSDGKAYLYAKAYIMPEEAKLRSYLRRAKAVGKNVAVSVFGKAEKAIYDATSKAYTLVNFTLQSVDFARSKSEGIPNDGTLILASEMVNEEESTMKREDVIKSLNADELRTHNPDLVAEMEAAAKDSVNVSEMETITGMVGEKPAEAIAEMQRENRELKLDQDIAGKVRAKSARPVLREMVIAEMEKAEDKSAINVAEMVDAVLAGDEGRAIIESHVDRAPRVDPRRDAPAEHIAQRSHTVLTKRSKK